MQSMPTFDKMMNPLLDALDALGGSATNDEIDEKVIELMGLPEEVTGIPHKDGSNKSEVCCRLAWTKTWLKKYGILENSIRGVWSIRRDVKIARPLDEKEVVRVVKSGTQPSDDRVLPDASNQGVMDSGELEEEDCKQAIRSILLSMEPGAFERLTQRLLREAGFIQVEVTGRAGDGGVDGKGIIRLNGVLSFHMIFQCKRYGGSVGPGHIRDFRGAMQGRADKGLFITTGTFTRDAVKEAIRDGAPPIDLMDGDELIDKLIQLGLGVKEVIRKDYEVDADWFERV